MLQIGQLEWIAMTREIVLDTETTGIDPKKGHRIIEIGALEMINHMPTGQQLHLFLRQRRGFQVGGARNVDARSFACQLSLLSPRLGCIRTVPTSGLPYTQGYLDWLRPGGDMLLL